MEYYDPMSVAGTPGSLVFGTVTAVHPERKYPLVLSTGDLLEHDHHITKDKGKFNSMTTYKLIPGGEGRHSDAVMGQAGAFSRSFNQRRLELTKTATVDGFAPMDVMLCTKGGINGDVFDECMS